MKTSERILLGVLGGSLAITGHFIVSDHLTARSRALADDRHRTELIRAEAEVLLAQQEEWIAKEAWIQAHLTPFPSEEAAAQELLAIADSAVAAALAVTSKELLEVDLSAPVAKAGLRLQLTGSLEAICRWLHETQRPDLLRAIPRFRLAPTEDESSGALACELTLFRLYRASPPASSP
jgi:hypothetical protein